MGFISHGHATYVGAWNPLLDRQLSVATAIACITSEFIVVFITIRHNGGMSEARRLHEIPSSTIASLSTAHEPHLRHVPWSLGRSSCEVQATTLRKGDIGLEAEREDLEAGDRRGEEADFEAPVSPRDTNVDALKRYVLDRLPEVLARLKTAGGETQVQNTLPA